ncbi:MAG: Polyketide cyclase / dehydrase and lipid transport [Candidatus Saccharibacteria bacterium]|nr:Polyketide cyclase / dehydrase and lipid transport [Candidatus Saccharibacteria bacterium]
MKAKIITKVTISSPSSEVFKYLTDLKYMHLWNPQVKEVSSKKVLELHSTYQTVSQVLGVVIKANNSVTKYSNDQELQIENTTGTVNYVANFKLTPTDNGTTLLICNTTVSSESKAFAFTAPVLKLLARRELQSDLQALKIAVENQIPHA